MCGYADYNEQKLVGNVEAPTHLLESELFNKWLWITDKRELPTFFNS